MVRIGLLILVPLAPLLGWGLDASPIWVFVAGIAGIAVLAEWIRHTTEQLALHTGPRIGGLLTVSLGSVAELILALFVLASGQIVVVHAQITGSIIGTCLFGLGLAILVGGVMRDRQHFIQQRAGLLSSLLILVVIALLLPAVFDYTDRIVRHASGVKAADESLSLIVSCVLLLLYAGNLIYTLVTHRDVFAGSQSCREAPRWSLIACLLILAGATAGSALESELVSGALTDASQALHLTPLFAGVVLLALVGTSADIFSAVWFAHEDRMDLVISICIGSAIQIALVVAPVLVIASWLIDRPMTLVFTNPLDLFAIAGTAFIVNTIASDGETTWFEGLLLIGVYAVFGASYFLS